MRKEIRKQIQLVIAVPLLLGSSIAYSKEANNSEGKSTTVSSSSAAPNMQQSANTAKSSNGSAGTLTKVIGVANMGLGAWNMKAFAASCAGAGATCQYPLLFQGILHFAMGAMSFKQSSQHGGSSYGANLTGIDTSAWNNPFGDPNNPNNPNINPNGDPNSENPLTAKDPSKDKDLAAHVNLAAFDDIKTKLTTTGINGVKLDPKSMKIFDKNTGKTYDISKLTDAKSMEDAGFSKGDIAAAMDASSKAEKAAMKKLGLDSPVGIGAATAENGYSDGGVGGLLSGKAGSMSGDSMAGYNSRGLASSGGPIKAPSNQVAGLTKNFNGERIGVSAENIFNMMTRRYKTKEKQNSFFDPSELVKMPQ
jgi:hypothetical protein